ncbi:hypothetical protein ACF05T_12730 [Streptomyces lateritius]|uniref:DUF4190 domain-containing protein n=1 Tax=Streptomyces lateritius TaxID=67313 RepID=A0ABW6YAX9_9ACTN
MTNDTLRTPAALASGSAAARPPGPAFSDVARRADANARRDRDAPRDGDEPDAHWWVAPLAGTVGAPALLLLSASAADMWSAVPALLVAGLLLPLAVVVPSWFLARRRERRQLRVTLAALACGLAAGFPVLLTVVGVVVLLVMLLTGNITA